MRTKGEFAAQAQTTALGASRLQKKVTDGAEKTFCACSASYGNGCEAIHFGVNLSDI
jgi:hypothetical protein